MTELCVTDKDKDRQRRCDVIELYKHFHTYDKSTLAFTFKPQKRLSRKHRFQLHAPPAKGTQTGAQTNFFFQRTYKVWNDLPAHVVDATDVNKFKNGLDDHWQNDPIKFNHKPPRE